MSKGRPLTAPLRAAAFAATFIAFAAQVEAAAPQSGDPVSSSGTALPAATWDGPSPFAQLDLPAANSLRTGAGRPGPDYWQQEVDYVIRATLDVATHRLEGSGRITYTNRSPDTLRYLWIQLDGNLCGSESVSAVLDQPPLVFGDAVFDFSCRGGSAVTLGRVESGGRSLDHTVYGTTMRVELPAPLASGARFELEIDWSWRIPEYGFGRMGRAGTLYQVANWYPRLAVYDDLEGWNTEPFIGPGEYYLEYGDFDVELTLPSGYLVAATGVLQNPESVLSAEQRQRLARARTSDTPVAIVSAQEARANAARRAAGTRTWRFRADDVRDFAFAAAPNFRWDASGWDGILIQTLYRPEALPWEEANRMSRASIRHFSQQLGRYPYPHATTVEGPIEGMEYPMVTFVPSYDQRENLFFVLTHEFGHEWFPMMVGSNERIHVWMDEGFNTFADIESIKDYFRGEAYADTVVTHLLNLYREHAVPGVEQEMSLPPAEQRDLFWTAYQKPALMLHLLRTEVIGAERFDRAFREYVAAWTNKHPAPADFFRMMEDGTGMDLDWFWRGWLYSTSRLDQAIESVKASGDGSEVLIRNRGGMIMPAELRLEFADGSTQTVRLPVEMWNQGPDFVYRTRGRRVQRAALDPRGVYPDVDRQNNRWPRGGGSGQP